MEHTFIMIKPNAFGRRLIGEIIMRLEKKGFFLTELKTVKPSKELIDEHYEEHKSKPWYPPVRDCFTSNKVVAMIWSGKNVVNEARRIIGATDPQEAAIGTIRGDLAMDLGRNLVHGSDSNEAAKREIALWFSNFDFVQPIDANLIYEN